MTLYVDPSALLKRYVEEPDSTLAVELINSDPVLVTSWITLVEVRRNLGRLLAGHELAAARRQVSEDLDHFALVVVDEVVCEAAAEIGEVLGVRSMDAIHLACAKRLRVPSLPFLTFDLRQAQAARSLGLTVLGV
ncbi:MAG: type II toxin-antitoxin system VapC family toxin [Acidobacteria bacterium]|nr:type II toxin-antitoxin system VapC family toxin [Acidobacteriota bacterium]